METLDYSRDRYVVARSSFAADDDNSTYAFTLKLQALGMLKLQAPWNALH